MSDLNAPFSEQCIAAYDFHELANRPSTINPDRQLFLSRVAIQFPRFPRTTFFSFNRRLSPHPMTTLQVVYVPAALGHDHTHIDLLHPHLARFPLVLATAL